MTTGEAEEVRADGDVSGDAAGADGGNGSSGGAVDDDDAADENAIYAMYLRRYV